MMLSQFVDKGSDKDLVKSLMDNGSIDEELAKSMGVADKSRTNAADGDNEEGDEEKLSKGDGCDGCGDDADLKKSGDTNEADDAMLEKGDDPEKIEGDDAGAEGEGEAELEKPIDAE